MDRMKEAVEYFDGEISQYNTMLDGVLSDEYRDHIIKKKRIFELARKFISSELNERRIISSELNERRIVSDRIAKICSGATFGEYSVYDDAIFPYKLITVVNFINGDILVSDLSVPENPSLVTNVNDIFIEGVDDC